jgi:hypothetical protein
MVNVPLISYRTPFCDLPFFPTNKYFQNLVTEKNLASICLASRLNLLFIQI